MERLTEKQRSYYIRTNKHIGVSKESLVDNNGFLTDYANKILTKLADYEDAEEVGLLVRLPCNTVYFIVDPGTPFALVFSRDIREFSLFDIENIDYDGMHWSTREAAEKALEAMKK